MTPSHCSDLMFPIRAPRRSWALRLLDRYLAAQSLHKQHQALLRLDETLLRDIGISRSEALDLAAGPVWDAPNHWKR